MDLYIAVCSEEKSISNPDGSGELYNYKNCIREVFFTSSYSDFATLKEEHEKNDNTLVLQITEAVYNSLKGNLTVTENSDIPKWQVNFDNDQIGSYSDPSDLDSTWSQNTACIDPRYILRLRHNNTFVDGVNTAPTITDSLPDVIKLEQYDKTDGAPDNMVQVGIEVFNRFDSKMSGFSQNDIIFYNGSTPTIIDFTNGYGLVYLRTDKATSKQKFGSNHVYRLANDEVKFEIRSRTLND